MTVVILILRLRSGAPLRLTDSREVSTRILTPNLKVVLIFLDGGGNPEKSAAIVPDKSYTKFLYAKGNSI